MAEQLALTLSVPGTQIGFPLLSTPLAAENQSLQGWFVGDAAINGLDPARQAFEDAVKEFRTHVSEEECSKWLNSSTTIYDVEGAVNSAKEKYEKKSPKSRARRWLASCSSRLMYYSVIMDTLAQHHPEYVSLAWGAIKFLFIAVINHEELLTEISKTVAKIAVLLPRADLSSNLYPTQRMRVAVAQLYAKVMYFVQDAVKWYKKGKIAHSVSAVFKPYDLGFKAIVEEISEASRRVDQEASAALKAEIRGMHIELQQFRQLSLAHFSNQNLSSLNVAHELAHQTGMLRQQQMIQITSMPALSHLPNADESLSYCRSIKTRRRAHFLIDPSQISKLRDWHEDKGAFPILITHGRGLRTIARDFSVELLDTIRASGVPAVWALSHTTSTDETIVLSLTDILLSLTTQVLALNPQVLNDGVNPISSYHFQNIANEDQCFQLLKRCLRGVSQLYVVLDLAVVNAAVDYDTAHVSAFIQKFLNLLLSRPEKGIKLVIAVEEFENAFDIEEQELLDESHIVVGGQSPGPLKRRGITRGVTKYSSHVFPLRSGSTSVVNWLAPAVDKPDSM